MPMNISTEDRQFIIERLEAGDKQPDIALALLMRQAEYEVHRVAQQIVDSEAYAARYNAVRWYPFLAPLPRDAKPTPVYEGESVIYFKEPQRQSYKVLVKDLDQFCRDMKLDAKKMADLGEGHIQMHRGWERMAFGVLGVFGESGRQFVEPRPVNPPVPTEKKEKLTVYNYAAQPITYSPPEK